MLKRQTKLGKQTELRDLRLAKPELTSFVLQRSDQSEKVEPEELNRQRVPQEFNTHVAWVRTVVRARERVTQVIGLGEADHKHHRIASTV